MAFQDFLNTNFYNNTGQEYLIALLIFIVVIVLLKLLKDIVIKKLQKLAKKSKTHIDDIVTDVLATINWPFYVYFALYGATRFLTITPPIVDRILFFLLLIVIVYYIGKAAQALIDHFINMHAERRKDKGGESILRVLGVLLKVAIWTLAVLLILNNLGIEITPLIAGLGVGGIAIAFALQNVIEDLFSAFTIYLDKPFKEGDFIIIGSDMGTIKHIGLRSTRIQALQGQELVVSNRELTTTRINNYKRMNKRRISFTFGIEYDTPVSKMKKIPKMVEKIVKDVKHADLDRVHFKEFGDFSLNYEVVYYVDVSDYKSYMDTQQEINLSLKDSFEKEGIAFAFPTQTLHISKK
jgi:small-conductance mechanosensitive channel